MMTRFCGGIGVGSFATTFACREQGSFDVTAQRLPGAVVLSAEIVPTSANQPAGDDDNDVDIGEFSNYQIHFFLLFGGVRLA